MIRSLQCRVFELSEICGPDPITFFLQDFDPGQGRILIECYGLAWAAYWNSMSGKTICEFLSGCDSGYVVNKLWPSGQKRTKKAEQYLTLIVDAVLAELRTLATVS